MMHTVGFSYAKARTAWGIEKNVRKIRQKDLLLSYVCVCVLVSNILVPVAILSCKLYQFGK